MANTTTAEVTPAVNYFYDRRMLQKAMPLLVHLKWAQVRDIPKGSGKSIRFRRYSLLSTATTALTEGVTPAGSQLSITNVNATVAWYGDYVTLTDQLVLTTFDPLLTETAEILGEQAGETLDELCRDIIAAGTTIQYAASATADNEITSSMKISKAEIKEAVRTLKTNKAKRITSQIDPSTGFNTSPIPACYIGIVSQHTTFDLKDIPGFIRVEEYPSSKKAMEGEVGALDEVRFVETPVAYSSASAGAGSIDVYYTIILGQNAYGISRISGNALKNIIKPLGSAGTADPLDQRQTSGWKASFVAKILNENFLVVIHHAVSS